MNIIQVFFFLLIIPFNTTYAADENRVDIKSGAYSGAVANNKLQLDGGGQRAPLPNSPYPSSLSGPGIFTGGPTRTPDQLYEPLIDVLNKIGGAKNVATGDMVDKMSKGIDEEYPKAKISFAPTPSYMWAIDHISKTDMDDRVMELPVFTPNIKIKGSVLGVVSISSRPGVTANELHIRNVLQKFVKDYIKTYLPTQNLYFVYVPGGSGVNIGIISEAKGWGLFATIGSLLGQSSGGFGGTYNQNMGNTQYATTYGHTILVIVEDGAYPIIISTEEKKLPVEAVEVKETLPPVVEEIYTEVAKKIPTHKSYIHKRKIATRKKTKTPRFLLGS